MEQKVVKKMKVSKLVVMAACLCSLLILGLAFFIFTKPSLKVTFDGEVIEGAEVYLVCDGEMTITKIKEDGVIELPNRIKKFASLNIHIVGEPSKHEVIDPLWWGDYHYDFSEGKTEITRSLLFYHEHSVLTDLKIEELEELKTEN